MNEPTNSQLLDAIISLKEDVVDVKDNVAKVRNLVDGGSEPDRGMLMRLKLAERDISDMSSTHKAAKKAAWTAAAGALTAAGAALWERFRSGGAH